MWLEFFDVGQKLLSMSVALFSTKVGRRGKVSLGGVGGIITLMEDVSQMVISLPVVRRYLT